QARQEHGGDGRKRAQIDFGQPEARIDGRHDEVASHGQLHPAAQTMSFDHRQGRSGSIQHGADQGVKLTQHFRGALSEVVADFRSGRKTGGEPALPNLNQAYSVAARFFLELSPELADSRQVEDVEWRPLDRQAENRTALFSAYRSRRFDACAHYSSSDVPLRRAPQGP